MKEPKIVDDLHPEDIAMLQALQSRSPDSVEERLEKVREVGSGQFMDKFYVGYGHKSIGDCGTTTIFLEDVSMLVAKAVQDSPLYNGQEASTRYMDFSNAEFFNPVGSEAGEWIQERWREFYLSALEEMEEHIREQYPMQEGEDEKQYTRAVKARVFDVLRSMLPAGAATNLSWHTNLRQASDHIEQLINHPDEQVRDVGLTMLAGLRERYGHSFGRTGQAGQNGWRSRMMLAHHVLMPGEVEKSRVNVTANFTSDHIPFGDLDLLRDRPRRVEIPRFMNEYGQIRSEFHLDFGSYRDLQRHRAGTNRMPLLTMNLGFGSWYLMEMPKSLRVRAVDLVQEQSKAIEGLKCDVFTAQNYIAMGFKVPCRVTQGLPGFVYRLELRSGKTVHPTLREIVHEEIKQFGALFPDIKLYVDMDKDSWTVRRGSQTIEEK
jgi:hypothetical protein